MADEISVGAPETPMKTDILIIGAGIVGLALATVLKRKKPELEITIAEKEADVAQHASGRNSGVLHAGFYYTADSLKARFTVEGNRAMREYCRERGLPINACGKLVVAQNESELDYLSELEKRGQRNGSDVSMISAEEAEKIDPNARTYKNALFSPATATVDPTLICQSLKNELSHSGVRFLFGSAYRGRLGNSVRIGSKLITARQVVNSSGLYADKIAQDFGFGRDYTMMPFKGLYLKYKKNKSDIRTNIYPVPNRLNPFLGVHFTITVDGTIKIGPTAIPCFWREQYGLLENFSFPEALSALSWQARLFLADSFGFRRLAFEEIKKYNRTFMIEQSAKLVKQIDRNGFGEYTRPGIRAQLLNRKTKALVTDFIVEGDRESVHILNAVSPAFTCSFPFAEYVVEKYLTFSIA